MITLSIKKGFGASKEYRCLKIHINHSQLIYRYSIRNDNDYFIQRLSKFIENDLINNCRELNENINMFYVDIENDEIIFIDRETFNNR